MNGKIKKTIEQGSQVDAIAIPSNHFKCEKCEGIFKYGWPDEEAIEEKEQNFPGIPLEECAIICDDCYDEVMGFKIIIFKR